MNQPLGILIKFEHHVHTWQTSLQDKPLTGIDSTLVSGVQNPQMSLQDTPLNGIDSTLVSGVQNPQTILQDKPFSGIDSPLVSGVQVHTILANSTRGKLLIDYYNIHKELNDTIRGNLVDLIIHDIISNDVPMSISLAESVAEQIVTMFPSEIKASVKI